MGKSHGGSGRSAWSTGHVARALGSMVFSLQSAESGCRFVRDTLHVGRGNRRRNGPFLITVRAVQILYVCEDIRIVESLRGVPLDGVVPHQPRERA